MADKFDERAVFLRLHPESLCADKETTVVAALRAADRDARDAEWDAAIEAAAKIADAERRSAMRPGGASGAVMETNLGREKAAKHICDAIRKLKRSKT